MSRLQPPTQTLGRDYTKNPSGPLNETTDWRWSIFRHYAFREMRLVEIESEWKARNSELQASDGAPRTFLLPG